MESWWIYFPLASNNREEKNISWQYVSKEFPTLRNYFDRWIRQATLLIPVIQYWHLQKENHRRFRRPGLQPFAVDVGKVDFEKVDEQDHAGSNEERVDDASNRCCTWGAHFAP